MNFLKSIDFKLVAIIIALVTAESFAQLFLEKATLKSKKNYYLIYGILLYILVGYLYYIALTSKVSLAITNIIWQTATIIIITLISIFYFKQKLTKREIIGIVILLIGSLFFIPIQEQTLGGVAIGGKGGFAPPITNMEQARRLAKAIELKDYES
jgi:drug/metabolite transporter (DMT)-like permease